MDRKERTEQKMQKLFHSHAAGDEGADGEFMQILQGYIFGEVCYTGSLDDRVRELVTVTVLTTLSALPQLKAHVPAALNAGCTPVEVREAVYQRLASDAHQRLGHRQPLGGQAAAVAGCNDCVFHSLNLYFCVSGSKITHYC